ncbi:MAG: methyltransferase domain-containing protein [Chloroflexi bacterium]|nr:MAG: methyltransferase domain-containing protein [Chloroflexota bacterium]MBL1195818.1 ubiquinone/menaquinone biosynthesis methyltransferase [Chloroflexota bacterium]NOH13110.1 ubiquinone/menaquinone biosynthesis methyltransferase [Chloroflexota bacterium]
MSHLTGTERATYVRSMFGRIAHRYDLLNRLMTMGQDAKWRTEAIKHLELDEGNKVLDLGSGTGDIAFEIAEKHPHSFVIASDFTPEMILVGKTRPQGTRMNWLVADAQNLPFPSNSFDGVVSGFLLRNVPDVDRALQEQKRILVDGGRVVSLDTTPPRRNLLRPFLNIHFKYIIPTLGRLIAGDAEAYTYLPDSTAKFKTAEDLAERFVGAGFSGVGFARRMLGTIGIHWGKN